MPIVEREIDVTVNSMTLKDNFKVLDGTDTIHYFTFYRELTEAFCNALFDVFDEINEAGILTITHQHTYDRKPVNKDAYSSASFNIFGCDFNVLVYEMYKGTVDIAANPQNSCPRVCIIRQFATLPEKDCGSFYKTNSASNTGLGNYHHAKMTEYRNPLRLCFKLVINYNEDFIDISFRNTTVNTNGYNWTLPIFTAIKCQSITYRDAVYYATCCNLYFSSLNYHRLVFLDDIKNTYRGDDTEINTAAQSSTTSTTSANLFLQIDVSNIHFTNLLQADNTRLELYKPICCTGFIQFSDNIMCAFDDAKVVPGEYYSINDSIYYVPGSNANINTYRHLILKV